MSSFANAVSEDDKGILIAIEVVAGAKSEAFPAGYNEWRRSLGCRVTSPALEGRANKAVLALVARVLGVPASAVTIQSGATASQKKVRVAGMTKAGALSRLDNE
jgi:hypothetical protein